MYAEASVADLRQMFDNTVVMYNKWPVFIKNINDRDEVVVKSLSTGKNRILSFDDDRFDFTPVSLGLVNCEGSCIHVARTPIRRWKQGFSFDHAKITELDGVRFGMKAGQALTSYGKELVNTIKKNYPTYNEALELAFSGAEAVAFNNDFAVNKEGFLFYKYKKVGLIDEDNGNIVLMRGKAYLKVLLEKLK